MTAWADRFAELREATVRHREEHGCGAYPYLDGSIPAFLARVIDARKVVEVGTALGYTTICLADALPKARIDTIEIDSEHAYLARKTFLQYGVEEQIELHNAAAETVLPELAKGGFDFALFDGFEPTIETVGGLRDLLRSGGLLFAANMTLGGSSVAEVKGELADSQRWITTSLSQGETALALKL